MKQLLKKKINFIKSTKNKILFVFLFIAINIFITNYIWHFKSSKTSFEVIDDETLKSEIKALQERIESLNLIISEKQKLINYLELQGPSTTDLYKSDIKLKGLGGKESRPFDKLSLDDIKNELNFSSKKYGIQFDDKQTIYEYTPTIWPTRGYISSKFGYRMSPFTNSQMFHEGLDLNAPTGTDIYAAASGTVIFSGYKSGYGNFIVIQHKYGYATAYGHCSKLLVTTNQQIKKGQLIALVGNTGVSTGPHLHYEIRINGIPVDPELYMISRAPMQYNQFNQDFEG